MLYSKYVYDISILVWANSGDCNVEIERIIIDSIHHVPHAIHKNIKVTKDYSTRCPNNRLLVFDIGLWLKTVKNIVQLLHSYYIKPIAFKYIIHKNSTLTHNVKIYTLIEIMVRIMDNASLLCKPYKTKKSG